MILLVFRFSTVRVYYFVTMDYNPPELGIISLFLIQSFLRSTKISFVRSCSILIFNPCWNSGEGEKGLDNMLCIMALSTLLFFPLRGMLRILPFVLFHLISLKVS